MPRMGMAAYAASKAAATMFTKCLGLELARDGIRCNVVSPGSTDTAMQRALWTGRARPRRRVIAGSPGPTAPASRWAASPTPRTSPTPSLFLVSDRARHITMHDLCVDGGATLRRLKCSRCLLEC